VLLCVMLLLNAAAVLVRNRISSGSRGTD
jgi:hypothetical protein